MKSPVLLFVMLMVVACSSNPDISDEMLDGKVIFDPSLIKPEAYLVSYAIPNPTPVQASTPVIIACHGYSATTFEWNEFRLWLGDRQDIYLSQVLLGGHGRTYEDFKSSCWRDWQLSIIEEYTRLRNAGFNNISLAASSASCALILELLASDFFDRGNAPKHIFFVDPIVIPSNKMLSLTGIVGPLIGYTEQDQSPDEDQFWYHYRPEETLRELQKLLNVVRKDLQRGIELPSGCKLKTYKSKKDPTADPVSSVLIYKGIKNSDGSFTEVKMVDSDLHVFTRLALRPSVTVNDETNQLEAFSEIVAKALE